MSEQPKRKAAQAPLSAHPAFPAIVALWFAALLGIGSLVLPIALFESASEATGLSSFVVAAQPPLGVAARIAIAFATGGLGVFAGLAIARRVIAASAPRAAPRRAATMRGAGQADGTSAKRPISAHEELGEGGLDAGAADEPHRETMPGRRRALSMTDESARSEFLDHAPLPGHHFPADTAPEVDPEPLDLGAFDADAVEVEALATDGSERRFDPMQRASAAFGSAVLSGPPVPGAAFIRAAEPKSPCVAERQSAAALEDETITVAHWPALGMVEPSDNPQGEAVAAPERPDGEPAIVDLVERFARALQQRREEAKVAGAAAADDDVVVDVTFAFPSKDTPVVAAEFAPPADPPVPIVPAALRPLGFDDFDDDEDDDMPALGLSLTARSFAATAEVAASEPARDSEEEHGESEESYSSLLAMKSPFGLPREAVRIDDEVAVEGDPVEPVVVFPGQVTRRASPAADGPARDAVGFSNAALRPFDAPATRLDAASRTASWAPSAKPVHSGETERALREALEKLQKMSGVA